ncbi:MAG: hypothetical protein ACTSRP_01840 [Candidatus Helarchaeota archaeon]
MKEIKKIKNGLDAIWDILFNEYIVPHHRDWEYIKQKIPRMRFNLRILRYKFKFMLFTTLIMTFFANLVFAVLQFGTSEMIYWFLRLGKIFVPLLSFVTIYLMVKEVIMN